VQPVRWETDEFGGRDVVNFGQFLTSQPFVALEKNVRRYGETLLVVLSANQFHSLINGSITIMIIIIL